MPPPTLPITLGTFAPAVATRSPSTTGVAIPTSYVCSPEEAAAQAAHFDFRQSSCPGHSWWPRIAEALMCQSLTIVLIGANKGYGVAAFLDYFAPDLGATPASLYERLHARYGETVGGLCGMCEDCKTAHVGRRVSRVCTLTSGEHVDAAAAFPIELHALEPLPANFEMLKFGLGGVGLGDNSSRGVRLHLHQAAAVGDPALESVPFMVCSPGEEGCGVVLEGSSDSAWAHAPKEKRGGLQNVTATTVDAFASRLGGAVIDVLTVDAEGLDPDVLMGAEGMLRNQRVRLLEFEYNWLRSWEKTTLESVVEKLDGFGYDCFLMQHNFLLRATGCWTAAYEFKNWGNVLCLSRKEMVLAAALNHFLWALPGK
jgi:FkbM family methyltransferase